MRCGLLGHMLDKSLFPQIHASLGDYSCELFEIEPEKLDQFIHFGDYSAIYVTTPYKQEVIPFLDELSPTALKIGSVNTIVRRSDGTLLGHNTEYIGFTSMVHRSGIPVSGKKVLVLGSGDITNNAVIALQDLGAHVTTISITESYKPHRDAALIVNTTPVGMYPSTGIAPLDLRSFPHLEGVLDVIYNPAKTQLLLDAEELRLPCENGLWMLTTQVKEASECFTGNKLDDAIIDHIHRILSRQMLNIVLIGMPGCGKSTIGALLSRETGRPLLDSDNEVVLQAGKSIPEIFAQDGESTFRSLETAALSRLGMGSGQIIATGGGCVTRLENLPVLRQNSRIFWLCRDLSKLSSDGRPLSQSTPAVQLFRQREPLYRSFADYIIDNNGTPEETVRAILSCWESFL